MIDIHCHMTYGVDDGSKSMEESVAMLQEAGKQGMKEIILTPHYRHGMFSYPIKEIEERYNQLKAYADEMGIGLYLGTEYHVNSQMMEAFSEKRCHTLADGRYILTEYSFYSEFSYAAQMTQEAVRFGYVPVIAHIERYGFVMNHPDCVLELQNMGALIQANADAILGLESRKVKKICKYLMRQGAIDIVASDSHGISERACHMGQCYDYVAKKYGADVAQKLFVTNPVQIISE